MEGCMKFRLVFFYLAAVFIGAIFLADSLTAQTKSNLSPNQPAQGAQGGPSNKVTNSGTKATPSHSEFAESANPRVVKTYSEDQLNDLFGRMVSLYSKDAVLFNNVGAAYFYNKIYDKSEDAFRRAIVLNNHPAFLTNLS